MNRRSLLSLVAVGAAGTAGCLSNSKNSDETDLTSQIEVPEQVESVDFSIPEKGSGRVTPPTLEYTPSKKRVRITGTMEAGNPCKETRLDSLHYDTSTDELSVLVAVKQIRSGPCPDSLGTDTYEVVITMESRLPETVIATHRNFQNKSRTTTSSAP